MNWHERQAAARAHAEFLRLTHPHADADPDADADLVALAEEIREGDPTLSLEQALDAAAIEQRHLREFADGYEVGRVSACIELFRYAQHWDASRHDVIIEVVW